MVKGEGREEGPILVNLAQNVGLARIRLAKARLDNSKPGPSKHAKTWSLAKGWQSRGTTYGIFFERDRSQAVPDQLVPHRVTSLTHSGKTQTDLRGETHSPPRGRISTTAVSQLQQRGSEGPSCSARQESAPPHPPSLLRPLSQNSLFGPCFSFGEAGKETPGLLRPSAPHLPSQDQPRSSAWTDEFWVRSLHAAVRRRTCP